jgi:hypothetical protein
MNCTKTEEDSMRRIFKSSPVTILAVAFIYAVVANNIRAGSTFTAKPVAGLPSAFIFPG